MSKTDTTARIRADGLVVEICADGSERPLAPSPMRPMTEAEVHAAAMADPDARPMSDDEWGKARRVPRAKSLRRALGLTREEFAARYQIPVATLRDWELGHSEPDEPARAYLKAIAGNPSAVYEALASVPG